MGNKYFTISFDDGVYQDARIVELMERYDIRGTFNLSSDLFGNKKRIHRLPGTDIGLHAKENQTSNIVSADSMTVEEALLVYDREFVEIASHGANHLFEGKLSAEELIHEVIDDARTLSEMFHKPVRGHIFPYGSYNEDVLHAMKQAGLCYGRTAVMGKKPKDFSFHPSYGVINPTCSHLDKFAEGLLREFLNLQLTEADEDQVFYLWGHGYELDYGTEMGCDKHLEKLFAMVGEATDVICLTNAELIDALNAKGADIGIHRRYAPEVIPIWGESIPYNTGAVKKNLMEISDAPMALTVMGWVKDIFGSKITRDSSRLDTFSYKTWIEKGHESLFMDDIPNIKPFIAEGADTAVVIAPGGGFCNKSFDGEGDKIARFLNDNGISAFVLDYRLNPYEAPVDYLDMQRAIRYVRYHAADYGLNPDKIGAMGFSAGGYVTGAAAILLKNAPVDYPGYEPDEVDLVNGVANFLGMLYPVTGFYRNPSMLALIAGDDFFDEKKRNKAKLKYDLTANLDKDCPPQFLCYGDKDMLKDQIDYNWRLKELKLPHETLIIKGAGHGYALEKEKYNYWGDAFVKWIKGLF